MLRLARARFILDSRVQVFGVLSDEDEVDVIREGKKVTYDMKPSRDDPTAVGTSEYADAIIEKLNGG